jgi:NTE family protein
MKKTTVISALALLLAACSTYVPINPPLTHPSDLKTGYRWATTTIPSRKSNTLVILTFSGGGTRAAGLSYGVLKQLDATTMPDQRKLLDYVDVISSVSGGSFASMDYGMRGRQMLADFESKFLQVPVQKMLVKAAFFNPKNVLKLLFDPNFHRIDVATQVYADVLFGTATYDTLLAQQRAEDRPFIIANATELEIGSRFEWTQDQFDPICSDMSPIAVAHAVAASSDFPVALPPVILKKYDASTCKYQAPSWLPIARDSDAYNNPLRPRYATELEAYLDPQRTFLHTLDGGIADNIGLRGPLHALVSTDAFVQPQDQGRLTGMTFYPMINHAPGIRAIDRVLVIVVNAGASGAVKIDNTSREPKLPVVLGSVIGTPMDNYSFDSMQLLIQTFVGRIGISDVRYYPVLVSFPMLRDKNLRDIVNNVGTSFDALTNEQLSGLKQAADVLVHQDPCFQQFMRDVNAQPTTPDSPICSSAPPLPPGAH